MTAEASSTPNAPLTSDEREELERLRRQAHEASTRPPDQRPPGGPRSRGWGRAIASALLITLGCVLVPLSVTSVWARSMVTDTNRYVDSVAPLASDPAVQNAITTNITRQIFTYIDVKGLTSNLLTGLADKSGLPPELATQLPSLAGPISTGIENFTTEQVSKVVQSTAFEQAWEEANRVAHDQLVDALTGKSDALSLKDDSVSINLAPIVDAVKQRLIASGFTLVEKVPSVNTSFVIYESQDVEKIQQGFNLLNTLGFWLPIICLVLIALGIYVARDHRRAFIGAGLGVALAMLAVAIALQVARAAYLDSVPTDILPTDAATVLYDNLVRFLRDAIRAGVLLGLIVAAGAFLVGPSVTATRTRGVLIAGIAALRRGLARIGLRTGKVTTWVIVYHKVLRVAVVAIAFLILLLVQYRTPALVVWLTVGVCVALFIIQFLATVSEPRPTPEGGANEPTPAG